MRSHGELSIPVQVLSAFHFPQHAADYYVGPGAKQDGELDVSLPHSASTSARAPSAAGCAAGRAAER